MASPTCSSPTSGDGFSFRWCPAWGAPAFNGGTGAFHDLWEYTLEALGFRGSWEEDPDGGWDEAWEKLRGLIDRGVPVQVGTHYSLILPYGAKKSPRLAYVNRVRPGPGFGHHIVIAGYDLDEGTVTVYEPNDVMPHSRYQAPINVFRRAWQEAAQREGGHYVPWPNRYPWNREWSLHDGYGSYQMAWVEPARSPLGHRRVDPRQLPAQSQDPARRAWRNPRISSGSCATRRTSSPPGLLGRIADCELAAMELMERGDPEVKARR
jgi:hypothetical protein